MASPEEIQKRLKRLEEQTKSTLRNLSDDILAAFDNALGGMSDKVVDKLKQSNEQLSKTEQFSKKIAANEKNIARFKATTRDLENQIVKNAQERADKIDMINQKDYMGTKSKEKALNDILKKYNIQELKLRKQLFLQDQIDGAISGMLGPIKAMSKIPFVGGLIDANKAARKFRFELKAGSSTSKALLASLKEVGKGALAAIGPAFFAAALKGAMALDSKLTEVTRSMGLSREQAMGMYKNLAAAGNASDNLRNNATKLIEVTGTLNKLRGTAQQFSEDDLMAANEALTSKLLEEESVGNLFRMQNMHNKSLRAGKIEMIGAGKAIERERKVRLDLGQVMNDALKVTGQIRAQIGANPQALMRATALAKSFGMELGQVAAAGKQMLNFEQSIGAELEAELLTGRQINLERARLYALTGDYEGLMREINTEVGDFHDFSKMNVLQQEALAKSMGMGVDQLSDMLLKEADLEAMKAQARAEGDEETLKMYERLSLQENFNLAMERLQQIFVETIGPAIISFVEYLQSGALAADKLKVIMGVGIVGAMTMMGVQLGLRIAQMSALNALAATQMALAAGKSVAASGPLAPITAAIVGGAVMGIIGLIGSLVMFEQGGIVTGPTLGMIGENTQKTGPEMVLPLNKSDQFANSIAKAMDQRTNEPTQPNQPLLGGDPDATSPKQTPMNINVTVASNPMDERDPEFGTDSVSGTYKTMLV